MKNVIKHWNKAAWLTLLAAVSAYVFAKSDALEGYFTRLLMTPIPGFEWWLAGVLIVTAYALYVTGTSRWHTVIIRRLRVDAWIPQTRPGVTKDRIIHVAERFYRLIAFAVLWFILLVIATGDVRYWTDWILANGVWLAVLGFWYVAYQPFILLTYAYRNRFWRDLTDLVDTVLEIVVRFGALIGLIVIALLLSGTITQSLTPHQAAWLLQNEFGETYRHLAYPADPENCIGMVEDNLYVFQTTNPDGVMVFDDGKEIARIYDGDPFEFKWAGMSDGTVFIRVETWNEDEGWITGSDTSCSPLVIQTPPDF